MSRLKRRRLLGILLFAFLVFTLGSGIIYYLLFSSGFRIQNIEIAGQTTISETEIRDKIGRIFKDDRLLKRYANYFTLPAGRLSEILRAEFPKIQNLSIDKVYPNTLRLEVIERTIEGVWCNDNGKSQEGECLYVDSEGIIFESAPKSYGAIVFLVLDRRNIDFKLGSQVLNEDDIIKFQNVKGIVSRNFSFGVKQFVINGKGEIEVETSENWKILLEKDFEAIEQFSNLKHVLDGEIREKRVNLEYVDLRLGNRIYYKMKN